jgi:hypothetical protein
MTTLPPLAKITAVLGATISGGATTHEPALILDSTSRSGSVLWFSTRIYGVRRFQLNADVTHKCRISVDARERPEQISQEC